MNALRILAVVFTVVALPVIAADQANETADASSGFVPPDPNAPVWDAPDVILYDNGPLVNCDNCGAGGAHESQVQTALGMTLYGSGHQVLNGNRVADDFTVPAGGWLIEDITFFAYQTDSTTASTMTAVNLQIWDGPPDASSGSSVIWGNPTTNIMTTTSWSGIYRVLDTTSGASDRPIMANTVAVNTVLGSGTYWLDWQADGTLASGPWAPPVTINGQTTTGNALQWTTTLGSWAPVTDGGGQQGFPFVIEGTPYTGVANDTCGTAQVIHCPPGGGTVQVTGSTWYATNTGPYSCNGVFSDWPEVWYRIEGNGGEITASTCNTSNPYLQSKLMVFDGSCTGPHCVAANEGYCGSLSEVTWPSTLGTDYHLMVAAVEPGDGQVPWEFSLEVTCGTACETLGTPTIVDIGGASCGGTTPETSPVLSWTDVQNESGYKWEVRDMLGVVILSGTVGANVTSVQIGPFPVGEYHYMARVQAIGDDVNYCDGLWTQSCDFQVLEDPPPPCEVLSAPTVTSVGGASCGGTTTETTPLITWTDVANDSGYRWEVRDLLGSVVASGTTAPNVTSVVPATLPKSNYTVQVLTLGDNVDYCDSEWSAACAFEIVDPPCEPLEAPSITAIGDTSCGGSTFETSPTLAWGDLANESGYRYEVRSASGQLVASGETAQNQTMVGIGPLEPGDFQARVQAIGDEVIFCDSEWSSNCPFEVLEFPDEEADFTWWPEQPKQGQRVRFADNSTGEPIGWFWDTDDGWSSTEQNPAHAFDSTGDFDVSMMCEYEHQTRNRTWTITVVGTIQCGDLTCEGDETTWSCPADCGLPPESTGRNGGSDKRPTVPAAVGGVEGSGGTYWMTEGWVQNPGDSPVEFVFEYTPLGTTDVLTVGPFELGPQEGRYWENLVEEVFEISGNGALWLDAPMPLNFLTRSYNSSPNGTFGQAVPAIRGRLSIARGDGRIYLIGLTEDQRFRSNLFFQEVDGEWVTLRVELFDGDGELIDQKTVDVGGHSNELRSLRSMIGGGHPSVFATVRVVDGDGRAAVIASVVDQITGDPTTVDAIHLDQVALKDADGNKLAEDTHHLVAVVAHTEGAEDSVWGTRFVINSPEDTPSQEIELVYIPEYDRTGVVGDQLMRTVTIDGGEQVVWEDVLIDLFTLPDSAKTQGALHVYSPSELLITSRTYNEMASGGTLGQLIKALAPGDMIDTDNSGSIIGMSHLPGTRTNVGIAVMTEEETEVELRFFSNFPALRPLGNITRTVDGQSHLQVTRVFEELGLSSLPLVSVNAVVTVNQGGAVYVYASSVDNASGDPTTIEATRN